MLSFEHEYRVKEERGTLNVRKSRFDQTGSEIVRGFLPPRFAALLHLCQLCRDITLFLFD